MKYVRLVGKFLKRLFGFGRMALHYKKRDQPIMVNIGLRCEFFFLCRILLLSLLYCGNSSLLGRLSSLFAAIQEGNTLAATEFVRLLEVSGSIAAKQFSWTIVLALGRSALVRLLDGSNSST